MKKKNKTNNRIIKNNKQTKNKKYLVKILTIIITKNKILFGKK